MCCFLKLIVNEFHNSSVVAVFVSKSYEGDPVKNLAASDDWPLLIISKLMLTFAKAFSIRGIHQPPSEVGFEKAG